MNMRSGTMLSYINPVMQMEYHIHEYYILETFFRKLTCEETAKEVNSVLQEDHSGLNKTLVQKNKSPLSVTVNLPGLFLMCFPKESTCH